MIRALLVTAVAVLLGAGAVAAGASAAGVTSATSSNWSGYAVSGTTFSSVSGSWVQPAATCSSSAAPTTASAFWVGLGGNSSSSNALEQVGTEADCSAGDVTYSAWYELVPAAAVKVRLKVAAGDRISASVKVEGTKVTLTLRNLTTKAVFSKTLAMAAPDTSSAEWIAEAPSLLTPGGARVLPLTDFGTIRFSSSTATSTSGHTGTISDSSWSATRIRLVAQAGGPGEFGPFAGDGFGGGGAVPTALSSGGSAFSVGWRATSSGVTGSYGA